MLLGLLWPDPCDLLCPDGFKKQARKLLPSVQGVVGPTDEDLRKALLKFIGDFANWDLSSNRKYIEVSRQLVTVAHGEEPPLVVDPFAGGGSIPLEALRLGCESFASDLNPVACLILSFMLEDIPRHGKEIVGELRRVSTEIRKQAERELLDFYSKDSDGATPVAYLWARTVRCESPKCGAEIPLARSFWLCKKAKRKRALRYNVVPQMGKPLNIAFEVFEPMREHDVPSGTVNLAKARCVGCGMVLAPDRVRAQLREQRGGAEVIFDGRGNRVSGAKILAVVTLREGEVGRHYRVASSRDYDAVWKATTTVRRLFGESVQGGINVIPHEPTPQDGTGSVGGGYRTRKYGIEKFGDFFTERQKLVLVWLSRSIQSIADGPVKKALALALGKTVMQQNSECRWKASGESLMDAFGRQALPIVWDFAEASLFGKTTGDFSVAVEWIIKVVEQMPLLPHSAQIQQGDACRSPLPEESVSIWFTDPPYYDSVPYADLSDFFFVWLKRALIGAPNLSDPWDETNPLTPKIREAVRDEQDHLDGRPKKSAMWYEKTIEYAFAEGRRILREDGVGSVIFAHKTTEGWVLAIGWNASRLKAFVERIWSSLVSAQPLRFSVATPRLRQLTAARSSLMNSWKKCGKS
jgi:adenine-specific DNA methylase